MALGQGQAVITSVRVPYCQAVQVVQVVQVVFGGALAAESSGALRRLEKVLALRLFTGTLVNLLLL